MASHQESWSTPPSLGTKEIQSESSVSKPTNYSKTVVQKEEEEEEEKTTLRLSCHYKCS